MRRIASLAIVAFLAADAGARDVPDPERLLEGLVRQAARMYGEAERPLQVHGLGMTEHIQGSEAVMLLCNLALLVGALGREGEPLMLDSHIRSLPPGVEDGAFVVNARDITDRVRLERRLREPGDRPSLTGASPADETARVLEEEGW